ncbi:MAG: hypothetical protein IJ216_01270, partial [Acidaminococcaceae bacterium]|nr:hypothetical protein [Acidaminococcaceae bacterium]
MGKISIHASLTGCDQMAVEHFCEDDISIHASLTRCDVTVLTKIFQIVISIHASLPGCDLLYDEELAGWEKFQSTHP